MAKKQILAILGMFALGSTPMTNAALADSGLSKGAEDVLYLMSLGGGIGLNPRATSIPSVSLGFGMRFKHTYEFQLELAHAISTMDAPNLEIASLSGKYFLNGSYGWFTQARVGAIFGEWQPGASTTAPFASVAAGYNFVLWRAVDLRPAAELQLFPASTSTGRVIWAVPTISVHLQFKTESLTNFLLGWLTAGGKPHTPL